LKKIKSKIAILLSCAFISTGFYGINVQADENVTMLINDDFNSYSENTDVSKIGYNVVAPEGKGGAEIVSVPDSTNKSLYLHDSESSMSAPVNYTGVSKTFAPQKGVIEAEFSFMQPGNVRENCNVINLLSSDGKMVAKIVTQPTEEQFAFMGKTAAHNFAHYELNTWYKIKVEIDMPNKKVTMSANDGVVYKESSIVEPLAQDVSKVEFLTPSDSSNESAGQYIDNLKIYSKAISDKPEPPTGLSGFPRDASIGITWNPTTGGQSYKYYASKTSGGPYSYIGTFNKTTTPNPSINNLDGKALVNGTPYYIVVTQICNVVDANGNIIPNVESGYSNEICVTPSKQIPIQSPQGSTVNGLLVNDAYNGYVWNIAKNLQINSTPYSTTNAITKIPDKYLGADLISSADNSKSYTASDVLATFNVNDYSDVFVALDKKVLSKPAWLDSWTDTEDTVELDNGAVVLEIYKKSFAKDEAVSIGINGQTSNCNNLFVMVKPQPISIELSNKENFTDNPSYVLSGKITGNAKLSVKLNGQTVVDAEDHVNSPSFNKTLNLTKGLNKIEITGIREGSSVPSYTETLEVTYYEFNSGEVAFVDPTGIAISNVVIGKQNMATTLLNNKATEAKNSTLLFVLYDSQGTMLNYSTIQCSLNPGDTKQVSTGLKIPNDNGNYRVKAFVWDSMSGMNSLSNISELKTN
jgi:hypothetical protein